MKVYNKLVIDMESLETIKEDSFEYYGEVSLCLTGGGNSGAVDFPDYMETIHANWLTGGTTGSPAPNISIPIEDAMNAALGAGGNPYTDPSRPSSAVAFDPTAPLASMQSEHDSAETLIDGISPETASGLFEAYMSKSKTEIDNIFVSETDIINTVDQFENRVKNRRLREISRWTGGMADINAVNSSQFVIGLALLENLATDEVNRFEHDLRIQLKRDREQLILNGVNVMLRMFQLKVTSSLDLVRLQANIDRIEIIAQSEYLNKNLEIDVLDATWDLNVYKYGATLLASISGAGAPNTEGLSTVQSALGGALSGAAVGAEIGGPIGAGIGGAIGLLGGLFG